MIKKHEFIDPKNKPMPHLAPNWIGYTCIHCGKISGLDLWQIADMPKEMATCEKSIRRAGFLNGLAESSIVGINL